MDEALRPFGLTTFQYTALTVLQHRGELSSAQLARRSFVRPQTMHEIVRAMEERGLIEHAHAPGNRRIMEARLTREGEELLAACAPAGRNWRTGCCSTYRRTGGPRSARAWRTGSPP
ncbi:MarR family winged helix-turn-helix transcriptional regulator [Streptomyces sp. NPDC017435]|uniref:MarR family winged helix-turn-helix transcriptional regulator n=1 Tax=Streptomyces sp. NPDC017435 TaxID=3364995 RepID=UPI003798AAB0